MKSQTLMIAIMLFSGAAFAQQATVKTTHTTSASASGGQGGSNVQAGSSSSAIMSVRGNDNSGNNNVSHNSKATVSGNSDNNVNSNQAIVSGNSDNSSVNSNKTTVSGNSAAQGSAAIVTPDVSGVAQQAGSQLSTSTDAAAANAIEVGNNGVSTAVHAATTAHQAVSGTAGSVLKTATGVKSAAQQSVNVKVTPVHINTRVVTGAKVGIL